VALNHVALTVGDRERSAAFYAEHFGLTERVHDDEHLLIVGDGRGSLLTLSHGLVPQGLPATNHFGFQAQAPAEVHAARERLLAAGVTETDWQDDPGLVRVQVADPDGYRVELFAIAGAVARPGDLPRPARSRWTSFVADPAQPNTRILSEAGNPQHRLRVEHNRDTLLIHLSGEDGKGWTVFAVDRATRQWSVTRGATRADAAEDAFNRLYSDQ
jgi:catechol 2,3-dioxygenase-like lactoylglutathione lyase family enzyme